jgi:tRNA(fMet)-specific endonuclease VapC
MRSRTFPLDRSSALRAGEVAATLKRAGKDIGLADYWQAGICFDRVEGLGLFDVAAS